MSGPSSLLCLQDEEEGESEGVRLHHSGKLVGNLSVVAALALAAFVAWALVAWALLAVAAFGALAKFRAWASWLGPRRRWPRWLWPCAGR